MTKTYFLHIPKTGGQSFFHALRQVFDEDRVCPCDILPDVRRFTQEGLQQFELYGGHLGYNFGGLLDGEVRYMTMLREPISRTLSHIGHIRRDSQNSLYAESQLPIAEFLALDDAREMLSDVQTYMIASELGYAGKTLKPGYTQRLPTKPLPGRTPSKAPVMRTMRRTLDHLDTAGIIEQACDRLAAMDFVGLTDRFDESLELAADRLNRGPLLMAGLNQGGSSKPRPEEVTPDVIEMIKSVNQMDTAVYSYGQTLFAQRRAAA